MSNIAKTYKTCGNLKLEKFASKIYVTINMADLVFDTKRIFQALFKQSIQKYTKQDILEEFDMTSD